MIRVTRFLEIIEAENLVAHSAATGGYLLEQLKKMNQEFEGVVSNARGLGLMCAFDLPDREFRNKFISECYNNGLLILPCGEKTVRFRPALDIPVDKLNEGLEIVAKTLKSLH